MTTLLDDGASSGRRHVAFALLVCATLVAASCSDSNLPTTPTTFGVAGSSSSSSSNVTISPLADNIVAQPVARAFCPTVSPFTVPFVIVVNSNGATGVVVNNFTMQFTDLAGTHQPSVTVPMPVPTQEFGTELTRARDLQFALSMGIGCGVGRSGTIFVSFDATDRGGHKSSGQTKISVQ